MINEIMYHPSSENAREEYVELYNAGTTNVDLSGWKCTKGIDFTFPSNTVLRTTNYLVIAAHRQSFTNKYPTITNVIGDFVVVRTTNVGSSVYTNYENTLSNGGEELELENANGLTIDSLSYADEGNWATRQRGLNDGGFQGWTWLSGADGLGKSLELRNAALPNEHGQNWSDSTTLQGTPGRVNSVASANVAPLIVEGAHSPIIPQSTNTVAISARIVDEGGSVTVRLFWRVNNVAPPSFTTSTMFDDGAHGDGVAGDKIYGALVPPQANGTIVEFYVEAVDASNQTNSWPRPAVNTDGVTSLGHAANALYQVDNAAYTGTTPLYKVILTPGELTELGNLLSGSPNSDASFNATFISLTAAGTDVRYLTSIRNRGHGSRAGTPHNYHIGFVSDARWKGLSALNMNARAPYVQHFGALLALRSGAVGGDSHAAQLRINGGEGPGGIPAYSHYAANESVDSTWAEEHFPLDSGGNAYLVVRDINPPNFNYRGTDPDSYTNTYFKESNISENDFGDVIAMLEALGENQSALFTTARARSVANVEQWMTHLAVMNLFGNAETGLNTGYNDDYYLYRGVNDPRFVLAYHDLDSILGESSLGTGSSIFSATQLPSGGGSGTAFNQFLHWPDFEPIYYRTLQRLLNTTFAKTNFDALLDQTLGSYASGSISSIRTWMDARRSYVQGVLNTYFASNPQPPTATISGEPRSPTPFTTATLTVGGSNVVSYRFKLNNGAYGGETPVGTAISLAGLPNGSSNVVSVIGKSSAGAWQDTNSATVSTTWIVNTATPTVRLNEVLAQNNTVLNYNGTFPDAIELYNEGGSSVDLGGMHLSDDPTNPSKFSFPSPTVLLSGNYLVVYANNADGTPGLHLGFSLDADGEGVYLFNAANVLIDSVSFGVQLPDLSVGRFGSSGKWNLAQPSFGAVNVSKPTGNLYAVRINEWLASGVAPFIEDFVELYNPGSLPVNIGDCYFTDNPIGAPKLHRLPPLTFMAANSFLPFTADGNNGPRHLNFSLSSDEDEIALLDPLLGQIDGVIFGPQQAGISQGRCSDGVNNFAFLSTPTPGAPNACPPAATPPTLVFSYNKTWRYDGTGTNWGTAWRTTNFNDSGWLSGPGVLGHSSSPGSIPEPILTDVPISNTKTTFYFRTTFVMPPGAASAQLTHLIDDGAVLYLNGQELPFRINMPAGGIDATTFSESPITTASIIGPVSIPMSLFLPGTNWFAVEVHQTSTNSSDIIFGLKLEVTTNTAASSGLVINEILANNESVAEPNGTMPDWVELYNGTSGTLNLSDLSLSDDVANPRRWVFPSNTLIAAKSHLRVLFDSDTPVSGTNTGFRLKSSGDSLYLFNGIATGGGLLDYITFGLQAANFSIGRLPSGSTNWALCVPSSGASNVVATLGDASKLLVNEWLANPPPGEDDYFEILNTNAFPVALTDLWLTDDLTTPSTRMKHKIARLSFIGVGAFGYQKFNADGNPENGPDHVSFSIKAGESVGISQTDGTLINGVTVGTQAEGVSEGRFPDGTATIVNFPFSQSLGDMNWLPLPNIVINEVLTHTDLPLEDAIEIQNTNASSVNITGWYLSNQKSNLKKYQLTNAPTIPSGGFRVFYETQFNDIALSPNNFTLNSAHGDNVYLSQAVNGILTGYRAQVSFDAAENGVSFGRYRTSTGTYDFVPMSARTFGVDSPANVTQFRGGAGKTNVYPLVGPVVISEIMFQPPLLAGVDNTRDEFIEIKNLTDSAVPLYDPSYPTNRWRIRGGVDYDLPAGVTLAANGSLWIVGFDPVNDPATLAAFKAAYGISSSGVTILGPWSGKLGNTKESIRIEKPDAVQLPPHPDAGFVPYIPVEKIVYTNGLPWPANANGTGNSLQRVSLGGYGNDPTNWVSAAPTPPAGNGDSDGDGMPDAWEDAHGLLKNNSSDAVLDPDGDGLTNLQEYYAGTDPQDPTSGLRLKVISQTSNSLVAQFTALANRTYTVQTRTNVAAGTWETNRFYNAVATNRTINVTNSTSDPLRFFRVATPIVP